MGRATSKGVAGKRFAALALLAIPLVAVGACTLISGVANLNEVSCSGADCGVSPRLDGAMPDGRDASDHDAKHDATSVDAHGKDVKQGTDVSTFDVRDSQIHEAAVEAGPPLIFDEEFDGGTPDTKTKWTVAGAGLWSIMGGEGVQTNATIDSMLYATAFGSATNYHIIARMSSLGPFDAGLDPAPEVVFRVEPGLDASGLPPNYRCNMDLAFDQLLIQQQPGGTPAVTDFTFPTGFDLSTPFVLDVMVTGTTVTCSVTVDTIGVLATVSTAAVDQPTGTFGLKTFHTSTRFQYFRVYAVP